MNKKTVGGGGSQPFSELVIEASALDFGTVWEASAFQWTLPLTNTSESTVRVVRFSSTCNCSRISPEALEIAPGETREVSLTLDLRPTNAAEAAKATMPFSVEITPIIGEGKEERRGPTCEVAGIVKRPMRLSMPFIDLGRHSELDQPITANTLIVNTLHGVDDLVVSVPPSFRAEVTQSKGDPTRYEVMFHTKDRLQIGHVQRDVVLTPRRKGIALPVQTIPLRGQVVDDIEITPPTILFGTHPVGTTVRETVSLRSLTGAKIDVIKAEAVVSGTSVKPADSGYVVEMSVQSAGNQEGTVVFTMRRPDGQTRTREIQLSCFGITR